MPSNHVWNKEVLKILICDGKSYTNRTQFIVVHPEKQNRQRSFSQMGIVYLIIPVPYPEADEYETKCRQSLET